MLKFPTLAVLDMRLIATVSDLDEGVYVFQKRNDGSIEAVLVTDSDEPTDWMFQNAAELARVA